MTLLDRQQHLEAVLAHPFQRGWDTVTDEPPLCLLEQLVIEAIKDFDSFLEVGPGIGSLSLYLLSLGKKVRLLDIVSEQLDAFRAICVRMKYPYVFCHHDIVTASFWSPDFVDCVFAVEVIEHIEDYQKAVLKMISLARKKVVITTPAGSCFSDPGHVHVFSREDFTFIPYPYTLRTTATKDIDRKTSKRVFFIEIDCADKRCLLERKER